MVRLILGDSVALLIFATMGRMEHGLQLAPVSVLKTALPFMLGWFMAGGLLGLFRRTAVSSPLRAAGAAARGWLLAWPVGLILRVVLWSEDIPVTFAAVVLVTNLILLSSWRAVAARWIRKWD